MEALVAMVVGVMTAGAVSGGPEALDAMIERLEASGVEHEVPPKSER